MKRYIIPSLMSGIKRLDKIVGMIGKARKEGTSGEEVSRKEMRRLRYILGIIIRGEEVGLLVNLKVMGVG